MKITNEHIQLFHEIIQRVNNNDCKYSIAEYLQKRNNEIMGVSLNDFEMLSQSIVSLQWVERLFQKRNTKKHITDTENE